MRQTEISECGLACLAIVASKLGSTLDLSVLRRKYQIPSRGMTLKDIKNIAADMGMVSRAVRCEVDELGQLKTPAILHWGLRHFVVLERVKGSSVGIHDPALGRRDLSLKEVSSKFTGVALELSPTAEFVKRKERSPLSLMSWFRLVPEMYGPLIQVLILSLLLQVYVIGAPMYIQLAIDQAALKGDRDILTALAVGFGLFCAFNAGAGFLRGIVSAKLTALLNWDMTLRLFRHMLRLPLPWFQRRKLADILSRFDAIAPVRELMSGVMVATGVDGLLAVATLVMMFVMAPSLAMLVLGGFGAFVLLSLIALPINMRLGMDSIVARIGENGKRIESIRAIQTVKVMGAENARESDWANHFANTIKCDQSVAIATLSISTIQSLIDGLLRVLLIYLGAFAIIDGNMSIGVFYAFLSYQSQFSAKAGALFDQIINWRLTDMYSFRLADIVLTKKEEGIDLPTVGMPEVRGHIDLVNLGFSYSPMEGPIFKNVSLSIEPGEFVAIVGPSGSGKSTLLKVLCGLYPATSGEVRVDGRPLASWGPNAIRQAMGVVLQDDELLSGTIGENVAFFDEEIDVEHVWDCLRKAALADDIMRFPMRLDTMLGDMGTSLSGGQKQRLCLARALYRRPRILVLDEATSHLDMLKETEINKTLRGMNITRIIVAHRNETIAAADRVVSIENGIIGFDKIIRRKLVRSRPSEGGADMDGDGGPVSLAHLSPPLP